MPGVPLRFKTSTCAKCGEPITDTQFEVCLGFCEVCHKEYSEQALEDERDPEIRGRLAEDLEEARKEFDAEDEPTFLDPEDQDGWDR